jgi:predicted TIM-barrel fold metal-dependent hydrolase
MKGMKTPVIDAHAHIFQRTLPMAAPRRYTPDRDALLSDYLNQLDQNGFTHGVLVQPSFLGVDNSYLLDALGACPDRLRGVVVVENTITLDELTRMAATGVVGVRLNLVGLAAPDLGMAPWPEFLARLRLADLHVELTCAAAELLALLPHLIAAGNQVVVDHFGRPDGPMGMDEPGFVRLLEAGATGQVWVKLSAAYRMDPSRFQGQDVITRLSEALGWERLVWGSDWPHTHYTNEMNFASARQQLDNLVPDVQLQSRVLGSSAQALFRIDESHD